MKFLPTILSLLSATLVSASASASANPSPITTQSLDPDLECGPLGIMNTSSLPAEVDPTSIRTCLNHPITLDIPKSTTNTNTLTKRACYYGPKDAGCSKGYCWAKCGTGGVWCWTAYNRGWGDWIKCRADGDCQNGVGNSGTACGQGGCKDCGCSC